MLSTDLIHTSKQISKFLRIEARTRIKSINKPINKPYVFYQHTPSGKYPIFIYSSFQCNRYLQGFCTPCIYSNITHSKNNKDNIYNSLINQTDYIIDNFRDLIINKQDTTITHKNLEYKFIGRPLVIFELCGEGSFLSNQEIPKNYREDILNSFHQYALKKELNMHVILETKASDILKNYEEFKDKGQLIRDLNLTNLIGLESSNEFTRNIIYNKGLDLKNFENSIKKSKDLSIRTGAFLFSGFHSLTQKELIDDLTNSIDYLRENNIAIHFMLPNLPKFTLNHLLYTYEKYKFPDPRTITKILSHLISNSEGHSESHYFNGYDWEIGGLTTYPNPDIFIFSKSNNITCDPCSRIIENSIHKLSRDYNIIDFKKTIAGTDHCSCKEEYDKFILQEERTKKTLEERVFNNLKFANKQKTHYIKNII